MNYAYYGASAPDLKPINRNYIKIENQRMLYELLSEIWCIDTCAPRLRNKWSEQNKTCGQCSITAFLAQDVFGGDVCGVTLPNGDRHCFNVVGDVAFDLTSEQFGGKTIDYSAAVLQSREEHFSKAEKKARYEILRAKLNEKLSNM